MLQRRDYGGLREEAMAAARQRARALAREGLPAAEINARLSRPLTRTEREVLTPVVRAEVHRARRAHTGDSLQGRTARDESMA